MSRVIWRGVIFSVLVMLVSCSSIPPLGWTSAEGVDQLVPIRPQPMWPGHCQLEIKVSSSVPDTDIAINSISDTKPPRILYNPRDILQSVIEIIRSQRDQMPPCSTSSNSVFIDSLTVHNTYALYPQGFFFMTPYFDLDMEFSDRADNKHTQSAKYSVEIMAPNYFETGDSKTRKQMRRAANTAVYYGVLYGAYDVEKCSECNRPTVLIYTEFGNGNWIRVKRLAQ